MFTPEYTITSKTLKNISTIEYGKSLIENTTILPSWEQRLKKDNIIKFIYNSLKNLNINTGTDKIKAFVDQLTLASSQEIQNLYDSLNLIEDISESKEMEEMDLKYINKALTLDLIPKTKQGVYRSKKIYGRTDPEEILAEIVQLFDWYNSKDAKETHPIIKAAILKASLEIIQPFENMNEATTNLAIYTTLKSDGYALGGYICIEDYYDKTKNQYEQEIESLVEKELDMTQWIEYFTEGMSIETANASHEIKLLAKDTKIAKATGRIKLSNRQERIVEYLQDYGILQNKDFPTVFPGISEDTVLRDLKALIEKEIIQKTGSTKSSRYELR